ncbi:MAG: DotU family type IV/VI secretion system protein [Terracidiphilus sp.]|nr:DotU family type IV/VI secretion system protein [Terracidiphilus sp.]
MTNSPVRTHSLASCYENAITTILRLGALQQQAVPNAQGFRNSIRAALKSAMEQAKTLGYSSDMNQLSFFAVVALLDESVLKLQSPAFAEWAQRPMQEEMFGHNRAGEVFFDHLRGLLARQDSEETADCLEVYALCMLLGFKGRHAIAFTGTGVFSAQAGGGTQGAQQSGEVQTLIRQAREKIDRIRGQALFLRAEPPPPPIKQTASIDRWSRGLGIAALCLLALTVLAFGGFWIALSSGATHIS